jgi:hypothetical protein
LVSGIKWGGGGGHASYWSERGGRGLEQMWMEGHTSGQPVGREGDGQPGGGRK